MKDKQLSQYRRIGMPSNVEPDQVARPAQAKFVWSSIFLSWMLSLVPSFPVNLLVTVIVFWCVHDSSRIGLLTAFCFGILVDVQGTFFLGENALFFTLFAYFALVIRKRLLRFGLFIQAVHLAPILFFSSFISKLFVSWINIRWVGWGWSKEVLFILLMWPLVGWFLLIPQRPAVISDSPTVQ
ncbi:MAG: rod shape-determining protein MreD [Candidatus Kinetoplastibacterium crithidii]|nr:MAG: rod shape-determining protein MreD [Candidatus Kinetoplastibacterium crithidii]